MTAEFRRGKEQKNNEPAGGPGMTEEMTVPAVLTDEGEIQPDAKEKAAAKDRRHRRRMRELRFLLLRLGCLLLVIYILFFHLVGLTVMPGRDMYPRLDAGDLLLFYRIERNFKAQDIVVIDKQTEADTRTGEKGFVRKALDWLTGWASGIRRLPRRSALSAGWLPGRAIRWKYRMSGGFP